MVSAFINNQSEREKMATTKDTYLVSLDSEHIAKLLETSDYYTETVIAKDVYFGD